MLWSVLPIFASPRSNKTLYRDGIYPSGDRVFRFKNCHGGYGGWKKVGDIGREILDLVRKAKDMTMVSPVRYWG